MKSFLNFRLLPILMLFFILIISCSKSDDDNNGSNTPPNENLREQYFTVKQGSTLYSEGTTIITTDETNGVFALSVACDFTSQGAVAELEFNNIPDVGVYIPDGTMGFAFGKGMDVWFCGEGCQISILTHDKSEKYLKGKVSGTMTTLYGAFVNNISCEFGVEY